MSFLRALRFSKPRRTQTFRFSSSLGPSSERVGSSPRVLAASAPDSSVLRGRIHLGVLGVTCFVVAACWSTHVFGQAGAGKFESFPMHEALTPERISDAEKTTKRFASTGEGNQKLVTAYFSYYVPAKLTAPDAAKDMSAVVSEVSGFISRASRSPRTEVFQKITREVFQGLRQVAEGNYSPSGRISAILLMSQLDQRQADNATRTPPIPLMANLPVFMGIYENEKNPDGVRAAALQGMGRLVTFGFPAISADVKTKIVTDMNALLDSPPPMTRTEKVHAFLQRYAVDILATLSAPNDPALGQKLISISAKPESQNLIALHSAAQLGRMGKSLEGKVAEPEKVLESWSKRALQGFEAELARLEGIERLKPVSPQPKDPKLFLNKDVKGTAQAARSSRGGEGDYESTMGSYGSEMESSEYGSAEMDPMYGMGGYDSMMGGGGYGMVIPVAKPQPPEVLASRRKLNFILQQLYQGVTGKPSAGIPTKDPGGLLASLPADKQTAVQAWVTSMDEVVTALNDPLLDDLAKYTVGLETQIELLSDLVGEEKAKPIFSDDVVVEEPVVAGDEKDAAVAAPAGEDAAGEFSF